MSKSPESDLPKAYAPADHEQVIYHRWEEAGVFAPFDPLDQARGKSAQGKPPHATGETFSILMPPPNANGALHVGHAVFVTLQDLMVRYHRMRGDATVWLPGLDHAGFETQVVFEKFLEKQGRSRFTMPRDEFYQATMDFTRANSKQILTQMKRLGASADWKRLKFTLDPDVVDKVYDTFVQMWEDGLAYRGQRPVHWCTKHQTTLSDLEVKDETRTDPLYYLKYGPLVVATGRPETIFADVAVAVHPDDARYQQYVGTEIEVDFGIETRKIPVVADEMVDPEFGTGVVKITPAHDPNDFEVAKRHDLPIDHEVVDRYGKLTELAGPFAGQKVAEAQAQVVTLLSEKGLIDHVDEAYSHAVKVCYKCNRTIEPRVLEQWFIKMNEPGIKSGKNLTKLALEAVESKQVTFVTDRFRKIYEHWLHNIRDWPISRQIVWGIRLPVWYCRCGSTVVRKPSTAELIFIRHGEAEHNVAGIGNGDPTKPYQMTAKGEQQILEAAKKMRDEGIRPGRIIASEMPRVRQSAEIIASVFGIDPATITYDARLNDVGLGELEGKPVPEIHELTSHHHRSVGGSETFDDTVARASEFLKDQLSNPTSEGSLGVARDKPTIVVTSEILFWSLRKVFSPDLADHEAIKPIRNAEYHRFSLGDLTPCPDCGKLAAERDQDVFDTWFSSGQWPVIVPETTGQAVDARRFYPTSVMETGWDILFFWVARMIMFGLYLRDEVPFKHVYLHGMVRDKDRQKLSKSKGNVIDPLAVVDQYGTDALRMALVFGTSAGNDMPMSDDKVRGMRNFANKLWNVSRFILMNLTGSNVESSQVAKAQTDADRAILAKLDTTVTEATRHLDAFRFHEYAQVVYQFLWTDLADTYVEAAKGQLDEYGDSTRTNLLYVLTTTLKLLHPIMPFVTEVIWQKLPATESEFVANAPWPRSK